MTDRRADLAFKLTALTEMSRRLRLAEQIVREQLAAEIPVEGREPVRVPGPYGQEIKVSSITHAKGAVYASVTDRAALIDWLRTHRPAALRDVTETRVEPWAEQEITAVAKAAGEAIDPATGEVIPGVTVTTAAPQLRLSREKGDEAVGYLVDAIRAAGSLSSLLELPIGTTEDEQ